jgi:putative spermidine/putrescine transport system substrate-binding protein
MTNRISTTKKGNEMTVMKPDRILPAMTRRQFGLSAIAAAAAGALMPRSVFAADRNSL